MREGKILIVEDDAIEALDIKRTVSSFGYSVPYIASRGAEAIQKAEEISPDLILTDIILKDDFDGIEVAKQAKKLDIPVIFLSAHSDPSVVKKAKQTDPYGYILKPYDINELKNSIDLTLHKHQIEEELKISEKRYSDLIKHMNSGVAVYKSYKDGKDFILTDLNRIGEKISALKKEDVVGQKFTELFPSVEDMGLFNVFKRVYKTGKPEKHPVSNYTDNRLSVWVENSVYKLPTNEIVSVFDDRTEYKKMENELKKSEEKYRNIIETTNEGVSIELNGKILYVNQRMCDLLGYTDKELIGHEIFEFLEGQQDFDFEKDSERLRKGEKITVTSKIRKKDGSTVWTLTKLSALYDSQGNYYANLTMHSDITEQVQFQQELNQSNENLELKVTERTKELAKSKSEFQVLIRNLESGVALIDVNGQFTVVNPVFLRMFGLNDKLNILNVNNQDWGQWKVYGENGELLDVDEHPVRKTALTGKPYQDRIVKVQNPGEDKFTWMMISTEPIFDKKGGIDNIICTYTDITDLKNAENTLKENEEKLFKIFNDNPAAITLSDEKGKWIEVNKSFCELTGYSHHELIGHSSLELNLINPKLRESILQESNVKGQSPEKEIEITTKSGENRSIVVKTELIKLKHKKRIISFIYDTTEKNKFQKALEESKAQLEEKIKERTRKLAESEELNKALVENAGLGIGFFDLEGRVLMFNQKAAENLNGKSEDFIGKTLFEFFDEKTATINTERIKKAIHSEVPTSYEDCIPIPSADTWFISTFSRIKDNHGNILGVLIICDDISQLKKAEANNQLLAHILKSSDDAIISTSLEGIVNSWNKGAEVIYGYSVEEALGENINKLIVSNENEFKMIKEKISNGKHVKHYETIRTRKDGKKIPVSITYSPIMDTLGKINGVSAIIRDISKQKEAQKLIEESLEDKEILLKEIHHRVKNNLTIIASLLNLQSSYLKDKKSREIFKESQNRAKSMALIHQRLYESTDLKNINFNDYISTLAKDLYHTYVKDPSKVDLNLKLEDIKLDINIAIPLGLILNELITNSMKYAFPEGKSGTVSVDFHKTKDKFILKVFDNGVGFPEDLDYRNTDSLGLQLVNNLTSQIDGEIELSKNKGTQFKIIFEEPTIS